MSWHTADKVDVSCNELSDQFFVRISDDTGVEFTFNQAERLAALLEVVLRQYNRVRGQRPKAQR